MGSKIAGRIVDVAVECFAREGFSGATTKDICTKADVTEGSLFRLFGSKEKLFEAALRTAFETGRISNEKLVDMLEGAEPFDRALRKAMVTFVDRLDDRFVRISVFALLERPDLARSYFLGPSNSVARALSRVIEREVYRGKLRSDINPVIAALELVSALWHVAFIGPILSPEFKLGTRSARREAVGNFVEIWFRGMEQRSKRKANIRRKR
jgi:AcrR family transcriptional regulator